MGIQCQTPLKFGKFTLKNCQKKVFDVKIIWGKKKLSKKIWWENFVGSKKIYQKNFGSKWIFGPKFIFD